VLMSVTGFVQALIWTAGLLNFGEVAFIIATFLICGVVSVSTGSSFGTILICGPILFPAGGVLGAHLPTLAGAIIGGATFGDCIAPISDTTIASALSQNADIGGTVRSRLKYVLPAAGLALVLYTASAILETGSAQVTAPELSGNPRGLPMLLVPTVIIALLLRGKHLLHGLLVGLMAGVLVGLAFGLLSVQQLLSLDLDNFTAKSFIIDGMNRAVGISFFTILLMGLVAPLKASGLLARMVNFSATRSRTVKQTELWIVGTISAAVLLTTHSIVAILTVGEFAQRTGAKIGIPRYRRANLLSLVACTFPFLLPYFIPVILMANTTMAGSQYGIAAVGPLQVGLHNFFSWGLLVMVLVTLITGFGRSSEQGTDS